MIGLNAGLLGAARTSRRGAAVGLWTPNEQVIYQRQNTWIGDSSFDSVTLLLHMDGANGGTTITDKSPVPKSVTVFGNAQTSTTQSKFGTSLYLDGTGDYLTIADSSEWDMPGDFTIEAWLYPTSFSYIGGTSNRAFIGFHTTTLSATAPAVLFVDTGTILFYGSSTVLTSTTALSVNTWAHVAFVRSGSTLTLYIDGASSGSATYTSSIQPDIVNIGRSTSASGDFSGYIDDLRITKGVARYTSNFAPASAPFPDA